ncbi:hypothetical protein DAPPUDRAFT_244685 [Daphnia pulex]|uniref:Fucosyltransferase n=1 Tax=Daphnia pulex TaxID=6669 RepID=E9GLJ2_DAPPU|nr:hypothetical protein DAPPUDRAFT_244685 [Daphnia pulex]|eukprot:EFX79684.1 hypothetical protein DAPPUDRAFT_244685 [Daphnia pulex]
MWNPWYGDFGFTLDDDSSFSHMGCKVTNCVLSKNKTKVIPEQADAIVFLYTNLCELPKIHGRQGFQRFVLLTDDPPMCYPRNYFERDNHFGSFFNWTISYRENADITWKRGWIEKLLDQPLKIRHSFPQIGMRDNWKKKKLVGWYVARCGSKSKREGYINELREYVEVDSYGPCGTKSCPETNGTPTAAILPCLDMLAENYKFVLAFEHNVFQPEVKDVVGQRLAAKFVHQFQIVKAVGHGEGLVGGDSRPVHQVGTVKGQQAKKGHAVTEVAQLGEIRVDIR